MKTQAEKEIDFAIGKINQLGKYVAKYFSNNNSNLSQNALTLFNYKFPKIHLERQKEYKKIIFSKIQQIFNKEELKNFDLDGVDGLTISIIDHHGILNHPWLYSANIVSHFDKLFTKKDKAVPIITLDCGNCPLNEPFHKRGFQFHEKQVNMFSKSEKHRLVYSVPLINYDIISRLIKSKKHILFSKEETNFLKSINQLIANIDYSSCERYSDQIVKINYYLWPLLFEKRLRNNLVDLITLEHDEILVKFLSEFLKDKNTFIYQMMFDKDFRQITLENFRGKYSAWEESKKYGTHFFWHIDKDGVQHHLYLNSNNELESDAGIKIKFELEEIINNLQNKTIIPSMFLKFSTVICYLGVVPLGGLGSVNYISTIKEIWSKIMPNKFAKEKKLISEIKTDGLITIPVGYEYNKAKDETKDMYAFDVFYKGGLSQEYLQKINKFRIDELLKPAIDFTYNYYINLIPEKERIKINFDNKTIYQTFKRLFE